MSYREYGSRPGFGKLRPLSLQSVISVISLARFRGCVPSGFYDSHHRLSGLWGVESLLRSPLGQPVPSPLQQQTVFVAFLCLDSQCPLVIVCEIFPKIRAAGCDFPAVNLSFIS
jgi:hypothetical protein